MNNDDTSPNVLWQTCREYGLFQHSCEECIEPDDLDEFKQVLASGFELDNVLSHLKNNIDSMFRSVGVY